jgi:hypothetical protein
VGIRLTYRLLTSKRDTENLISCSKTWALCWPATHTYVRCFKIKLFFRGNWTRQAVHVQCNKVARSQTTLTVQKQYVLHILSACACVCVCGGGGSVTKHAKHILSLLWLHHIFWYCLINGTSIGKKLLNTQCVLQFSLQLLFETFLILRIQLDISIDVETS